jgi:hypothetical protein
MEGLANRMGAAKFYEDFFLFFGNLEVFLQENPIRDRAR